MLNTALEMSSGRRSPQTASGDLEKAPLRPSLPSFAAVLAGPTLSLDPLRMPVPACLPPTLPLP